jgi:hypothetical protein
MIAVSPCLRISLPEITVNRDFIVPTAAQPDALAAGLPGDWAATIWLMHGCGLRVGEALAISERCVTSDGTVLRVFEQVNPQGQLRPLKFRNAGDYRDTPLPRYVSDAVDKHLADYGTTPDGYLFRGRRQKLVVRRTYQDDLARAARKAGLPPQFIPHSLRHYFASTALAPRHPDHRRLPVARPPQIEVTYTLDNFVVDPACPGAVSGFGDGVLDHVCGQFLEVDAVKHGRRVAVDERELPRDDRLYGRASQMRMTGVPLSRNHQPARRCRPWKSVTGLETARPDEQGARISAILPPRRSAGRPARRPANDGRSRRRRPWPQLGPSGVVADLVLDSGEHRRHAAQPERADQVLQSELAGELGWRGKDLAGAKSVKPGVEDAGEAAGGRRLSRGVEEQVNGARVVDLDGEEQRRLAFWDLLEQVTVPGVPGGHGRQLLGILQQQLQPLPALQRGELLGDVAQPRIERASGHGCAPRAMGTRTLLPHSVQDPS